MSMSMSVERRRRLGRGCRKMQLMVRRLYGGKISAYARNRNGAVLYLQYHGDESCYGNGIRSSAVTQTGRGSDSMLAMPCHGFLGLAMLLIGV